MIGREFDRAAQTGRWRDVPAAEKLVLALGLLAAALAAPGAAPLLALLGVTLCVAVLGAGIAPGDLWRSARLPLGFVALGTLAQVLVLDPGGGWPWLRIDPAQLPAAGFTALRSLTALCALLLLALTTPLTDLALICRRFGPLREIADVVLMMFRFIWLLLDCLETGRRSQENRLGYTTPRRALRSGGMLAASLLPRVIDRGRRLERGLAARGLDGELRFLPRGRAASRPRLGAILGSAALLVALLRLVPA